MKSLANCDVSAKRSDIRSLAENLLWVQSPKQSNEPPPASDMWPIVSVGARVGMRGGAALARSGSLSGLARVVAAPFRWMARHPFTSGAGVGSVVDYLWESVSDWSFDLFADSTPNDVKRRMQNTLRAIYNPAELPWKFRYTESISAVDFVESKHDFGSSSGDRTARATRVSGGEILRALADAGPDGWAFFVAALEAADDSMSPERRIATRIVYDWYCRTIVMQLRNMAVAPEGDLASQMAVQFASRDVSKLTLRGFASKWDGLPWSTLKDHADKHAFASLVLPSDPIVMVEAFVRVHDTSSQTPFDLLRMWQRDMSTPAASSVSMEDTVAGFAQAISG